MRWSGASPSTAARCSPAGRHGSTTGSTRMTAPGRHPAGATTRCTAGPCSVWGTSTVARGERIGPSRCTRACSRPNPRWRTSRPATPGTGGVGRAYPRRAGGARGRARRRPHPVPRLRTVVPLPREPRDPDPPPHGGRVPRDLRTEDPNGSDEPDHEAAAARAGRTDPAALRRRRTRRDPRAPRRRAARDQPRPAVAAGRSTRSAESPGLAGEGGEGRKGEHGVARAAPGSRLQGPVGAAALGRPGVARCSSRARCAGSRSG